MEHINFAKSRTQAQRNQEEEEDKHTARIVARMRENQSKIVETPITCDQDVENYFGQLEEGVSEEELNNIVNIKAGRLIKLWETMLSELLFLKERLKTEIDLKYRRDEMFTCSPEHYRHVNALINAFGMIEIHRKGIRISLENLRDTDPSKKCLAIISSAARSDTLQIMLVEMERGAVTVDTKDVKEVLGKISKVVEGQVNFYLA